MIATLNGVDLPIVRHRGTVLWCPHCGRSHGEPAITCLGGCGAVFREPVEASVPAEVAPGSMPDRPAPPSRVGRQGRQRGR